MTEFQIGYNATVEAIRNAQDLAPVVNAAYKPAKGRAKMAGVLSALGAALNICTQYRVSFTLAENTNSTAGSIAVSAPGLRVLLLQNMLDDLHPPQARIAPGSPDPDLERAQAAWSALKDVCKLVLAAASTEALKGVFAENLKPKDAAPPAPAEATPPLQVEIVGMPERITSTTVERNGQGDITETRQLEKDAV